MREKSVTTAGWSGGEESVSVVVGGGQAQGGVSMLVVSILRGSIILGAFLGKLKQKKDS